MKMTNNTQLSTNCKPIQFGDWKYKPYGKTQDVFNNQTVKSNASKMEKNMDILDKTINSSKNVKLKNQTQELKNKFKENDELSVYRANLGLPNLLNNTSNDKSFTGLSPNIRSKSVANLYLLKNELQNKKIENNNKNDKKLWKNDLKD